MTLAWGPQAVEWLWWSRSPLARVARAALLPSAALYALVTLARVGAYRRGWMRVHPLPLPTVAVGNLAVGGTGKTPLAAWIAAHYARGGLRPGVVLRGHGHDEHFVHQRLVPTAVVVADPDRVAGARRAHAAGAQILVLDDAFQHLRVERDLNAVVVATEHASAAAWPLPAGPWREGRGALRRAQLIIVTRRRAAAGEATALAGRLARDFPGTPVAVARLSVVGLEGMLSGMPTPLARLAGRSVMAAAGVGDPASFAAQLRTTGADVRLLAFPDHHAYPPRDVAHLVRAAADVDYVVVTEKDAVKLRQRWPAEAPEPLVAVLEVEWELNGDVVERALAAVSARASAC